MAAVINSEVSEEKPRNGSRSLVIGAVCADDGDGQRGFKDTVQRKEVWDEDHPFGEWRQTKGSMYRFGNCYLSLYFAAEKAIHLLFARGRRGIHFHILFCMYFLVCPFLSKS